MRTHIYIVLAALLAFPLQINGAPINLSIYGEKEEEQSASIHDVDSFSDASSDEALPLLTRAEDAVIWDTLKVTMDSVVVAEDSVPDWYVEPVIPAELRAPMRANAGTCLTDSILTFNADSVLTETTIYEYDAANRAIRTIVWKYDASGILSTSSKQEYAYDAAGTQIYTGTFAWDTNTNDWRGTAKSEFVYNEAHKMESNITYTWVNNTWLPSQALTYAYDAAGRETEFTTYSRNASANRLVPSNQRIQTWYNASKKTLEINYTAYSNGNWSAGNKKEYAYDSNGNQIEYTYYSSYSAGNWVGSTQEFWTYNGSNKKTFYEKYTFSNNAWSITTREITGYDAAGNTILVENYALKSGVLSGSKKEEYTFNAAKKKLSTTTYQWNGSAWIYNTQTINNYDTAGNTIEVANYIWDNGRWKGVNTRYITIFNQAKKIVEQIQYIWESDAWTYQTKHNYDYDASNNVIDDALYAWSGEIWVGTNRTTTEYLSNGNIAGSYTFEWLNGQWGHKTYTQQFYNSVKNVLDSTLYYNWIDSTWFGIKKEIHSYSANGTDTLFVTYNRTWPNSDWLLSAQTKTVLRYDLAGHKLEETSYRWIGGDSWAGISKREDRYNAAGYQTFSAQYSWGGNDWIEDWLMNMVYDENNHQIMKERYMWTNNIRRGSYKYEYGYDANGQQIMTASYSWSVSADNWTGSSMSEKIFNTEGQECGNISYRWSNNNTWIPSIKNMYIYDAKKRVLARTISRYNQSTSQWDNETQYENEYDASDRQIKADVYTWLNDEWKPSTLSHLIYDTDNVKLRREINGSWNNGVILSYTDKHYFYSCDAPAGNGSQPRTPTDIEEIDENNANYENNENNAQPFDPTQPTYNLSGQRVDPAGYHGLVIQSGHTYLLL